MFISLHFPRALGMVYFELTLSAVTCCLFPPAKSLSREGSLTSFITILPATMTYYYSQPGSPVSIVTVKITVFFFFYLLNNQN
jgi:hypothetical protein